MAMICASLASVGLVSDTAEARGPAYSGPQTQANGPAFFGPAPNPFPYCDSPTYFDAFPENVNPIGRMDLGDTASVTTDGITMDLTITSEGNPGTQYPGFFPEGGDGGAGDQPKGIELAEGDGASVSLSEPLFYSQWIFTDVDQPNEGFTVTPQWTQQGQAAAFGGDNQFTFVGTTPTSVELDDIDGDGHASESINGRVQVDFLGAVNGIDMLRTFPSNGQSGFAVGGGCEAVGAAKALIGEPVWNGTSYDVTYELRMRNNLPSSATIQEVINDAIAAVGASFVTGTPQGILLTELQLTDDLRDPAFSDIVVTSLTTNGSLDLNEDFNGITDLNLLDGGAIIAETDELITLTVQYTPDLAQAQWDDCVAGYTYLNQTEVTAFAAGVPVSDVSDNGVNAAPSDRNGDNGVDDPTPVPFDCPPGDLELVKTVVPGPAGTCPDFANGIVGDGDALPVVIDESVTYCISVRNPGPGPIFNVTVNDPQAPGGGNFSLVDLDAGETANVEFDLQVTTATPVLNTATANATDSEGPVDPASDTALIEKVPKPLPVLEIVKTVLPGANATCPTFDNGVDGLGPVLEVDDGDTVTYCISVRNTGPGDAVNVVISDPQAPQDYPVGTLATGDGATESYNLTVGLNTPTVNVATGTYSGPDGPLTPVTDNAQIDVSPLEPGLEIVKTVLAGANALCPAFDGGVAGIGPALQVDDRDVVTYCISVRNTGPGIATDVVISDAQAPGDFAIGTLAAGEESTVGYNVTASVPVAPATNPVVNTATAAGNGPTGPLPTVSDQAQITVDALPDPGLQIVKTALAGPNASCPTFDGGTAGLGDPVEFLETETVTYCISVRNVGPGPATNVTLTDDQAPSTFDLIIGDLAVDQVVTRSYDVEDLMVGDPTENTAIVNGDGLNGPLDPESDPAQITISLQPDPILEIVKTVLPGADATCPTTFAGGVIGDGLPLQVLYTESVTFCIAVRNVGGNPATSVQVTDDQAPGTLQLGTIPVGEEAFGQYNVVVDENTEPRNTATVRGQGPNGPVDPDSDTAIIAPSAQPDPLLQVVKTVVGPNGVCPTTFDDGILGEGPALPVLYEEVVTYCVTVRNVGANPATMVMISDPQAPGGVIDIGDLAVDEEQNTSYTVTVDANTPTTNIATATGQGPNGALVPATDPAVIDPSPQPDPVLEIVKTVVDGPNGNCPVEFADGIAGPGDPLIVEYGQTVTYCVNVRNVSGTTATDVIISDAQADGDIDLGTIVVGGQARTSYDVVNIDPNTPLTNTASVTGQGPNGPVGPETDTAVIAPAAAVLDIVKTAVAGPNGACPAFDDGVIGEGAPLARLYTEVVTYCLTVKNIGANPATGVVITDDQAPAPGTFDVGTLAPGEEATRTLDVTVDADTPTTNIATATGTGPGGVEIPPVSDPAIITTAPLPDPVLEIVKTVVAGPDGECPATFAAGVQGEGPALDVNLDGFVTYCVAITNTGLGTATDVEINDPQAPAPSVYEIGTLAPEQVVFESYDVQIGLDTDVINIAVVSGTGPNSVTPGDITDTDPAIVNLVDTRVATISLIHSVSKTEDCVTESKRLNSLAADRDGFPVTWCTEVRNTGNVALTNIVLTTASITDDPVDVLAGTGRTVLLPGEAIRIETPGAIPDPGLISRANVVADPSDNDGNVLAGVNRPGDDDNASVVEAEINIESTVIAGPDGNCEDATELATVTPGQEVTWCYTVSNEGSTTLRVTEVTDAVLGVTIPVPTENRRLLVDDSFVVKVDVVATGPVTNDGDVKGQPLGVDDEPLEAPEVEDRDDAQVVVPQADLAIVKTNSNNGPVSPGSSITYTLAIENKGPGDAEDVKVSDSLPAGLTYITVPTAEGWVCALDTDRAGFSCLKSDPMEAETTATLTYVVSASGGSGFFNRSLTNTATVTSTTPDPDPTDNIDTSTTSIFAPPTSPPPPPVSPPPPAPPAPPLTPPDEVLGLAITGAASNLLAMLAAVMLTIGGLFTVGARRSRDDE